MRVSGGRLRRLLAVTVVLSVALSLATAAAGGGEHNFRRDFDVVWGAGNARFRDGGRTVELSLDERTGARLQSKQRYLFGKFDLEMKLVPGESAGTITSFYICTGGARHDEVDFEFLGNASGEPYLLHTNIFSDGRGEREQQFALWFDPTRGFHTYTILWNPHSIILYVDGVPIRVFANNAAAGVPFPARQPVRVFASIWDAEDWATQGGRVKADWSKAPFVASYHGIDLDVCECYGGGCVSACAGGCSSSLSEAQVGKMQWVQSSYRIYDYCVDPKRLVNGQKPVECGLPQH